MRHHRRPIPALLALVATAAFAVACTSASPGWTYYPAPPPTPVPSGAASGAPASAAPSGSAAPGSAAPSGSAAAPGSAAPSGSAAPGSAAPSESAAASAAPSGGGGATVTITAQGIQFTTPTVTGPAAGFTLAFDNEDAGTPHDVEIKDGNGNKVFQTDIFPGVATKTFPVGPLAPGTYPFVCTIHSNMTGTLTVQ
jgi:plastocyanin